MRFVLLFLDGVGIGKKDPDTNPFFASSLPHMKALLGGIPHLKQKTLSGSKALAVPVNATLGIEGLPQSGTGQTAIFTGVNAPRMIGRHFGPFPTTDLRPVIEKQNIFRRLMDAGKSVLFANAFPKQFFDYTSSGRRRLTVTTLSCMMAGVPLLAIDALKQNEAISADITRERWPELGYVDLPSVSPSEAGGHLASLSRGHDFVLFEYWLTDHAGHSMDMKFASDVLERFDAFLEGLVHEVDLKETLIVMISDHGNIEDLSTKGHTRNPVSCVAIGHSREKFAASVRNLTHITPRITQLLTD